MSVTNLTAVAGSGSNDVEISDTAHTRLICDSHDLVDFIEIGDLTAERRAGIRQRLTQMLNNPSIALNREMVAA